MRHSCGRSGSGLGELVLLLHGIGPKSQCLVVPHLPSLKALNRLTILTHLDISEAVVLGQPWAGFCPQGHGRQACTGCDRWLWGLCARVVLGAWGGLVPTSRQQECSEEDGDTHRYWALDVQRRKRELHLITLALPGLTWS